MPPERTRAGTEKLHAGHDDVRGSFAGSLKGVEGKLDYIAQCHVNYLHLMPLLDTPGDVRTAVMPYLTSER